MTIACPICGHQEEQGTLFCSECGTKLVDEEGVHTAPVSSETVGGLPTDQLQSGELAHEQGQEAFVSLHVVRSGQILPLLGSGEFILGRVSEGQSILPDINLEPYKAYEAGVSRLHARIAVSGNEARITDLGSSNGTRVNKRKLAPHDDLVLGHKDVIRLGQLSLQVLINNED